MALKLRAELGGDGSGFEAMMNRAGTRVKKFAGDFGGLKSTIAGVFTVGAISSFTKKVIDTASHLRDLSDRLGVNVDWLQETGFAAKQAGADVEKLTKFLEKIGENREIALQGGAAGAEKLGAFSQFGISEADLRGSNLQQLFDRIAQAYKDGSQQALGPALKEVGGKSAYELAAAFKQGIEDNRQLARDAGAVMADETIDQLKAIGDQFTTMSDIMVTQLASAIIATAEAIKFMVGQTQQFGSGLGAGWTGAEIDYQNEERAGVGSRQRTLNLFSNFWKHFVGGVSSEDQSQKDQMEALMIAYERMKALRKEQQQFPSGNGPEESPKVKAGSRSRGPGLSTDPLVGIGNFLGRNPALINNVANQQILVARGQLKTLRDIFTVLKNSPLMGRMTGLDALLGIGVPSG